MKKKIQVGRVGVWQWAGLKCSSMPLHTALKGASSFLEPIHVE
jgi:hypothetical protein